MVKEVEIEEVCKSIYDEIKEDYVGLWSIAWMFREIYHEIDICIIRQLTFQVIRSMLERKSMIPGSFERVTFKKWNMNSKEALDKIAGEWLDGDPIPDIGEIVWFELFED